MKRLQLLTIAVATAFVFGIAVGVTRTSGDGPVRAAESALFAAERSSTLSVLSPDWCPNEFDIMVPYMTNIAQCMPGGCMLKITMPACPWGACAGTTVEICGNGRCDNVTFPAYGPNVATYLSPCNGSLWSPGTMIHINAVNSECLIDLDGFKIEWINCLYN